MVDTGRCGIALGLGPVAACHALPVPGAGQYPVMLVRVVVPGSIVVPGKLVASGNPLCTIVPIFLPDARIFPFV